MSQFRRFTSMRIQSPLRQSVTASTVRRGEVFIIRLPSFLPSFLTEWRFVRSIVYPLFFFVSWNSNMCGDGGDDDRDDDGDSD